MQTHESFVCQHLMPKLLYELKQYLPVL